MKKMYNFILYILLYEARNKTLLRVKKAKVKIQGTNMDFGAQIHKSIDP
jgi:hypothetical protein